MSDEISIVWVHTPAEDEMPGATSPASRKIPLRLSWVPSEAWVGKFNEIFERTLSQAREQPVTATIEYDRIILGNVLMRDLGKYADMLTQVVAQTNRAVAAGQEAAQHT
jgi:hypothetical protein